MFKPTTKAVSYTLRPKPVLSVVTGDKKQPENHAISVMQTDESFIRSFQSDNEYFLDSYLSDDR